MVNVLPSKLCLVKRYRQTSGEREAVKRFLVGNRIDRSALQVGVRVNVNQCRYRLRQCGHLAYNYCRICDTHPSEAVPAPIFFSISGNPWTLTGDVKDGLRRGVYADDAGAREALEKV